MGRKRHTEPRYRIGQERGKENYYIYWTEDGRTKRRSTATTDKVDALILLNEFIRTRNPPPNAKDLTLAKTLEAYIEARTGHIVDLKKQVTCAEKILVHFGKDTLAGSLTPSKVSAYTMKERARGISPDTIARTLSVLRAALKYAEKEGWLVAAPFVPLPRKNPPRDRFLTKEECAALLRGCVESHVALFIIIALNTGARPGAILELEWRQVDLKGRRINLNPPNRPETDKGRPVVPINDKLLDALTKAKQAATTPYVIEYAGNRVQSIYKGFRAACRRAGVKNATPHTLRHTAATHMAMSGVEMYRISKLLGHTTTGTTERIYAKYSPDYLQDAVQALNAI